MRVTSVFLLGALLCVSLTGCGGSGDSGMVLPGSAFGTAMSGGAPVANATVTAIYAQGASYASGAVVGSTTTNADGSFKISPLLPGTYSLNFSAVDPSTKVAKKAWVNGVTVSAAQNDNVGTIPLN
jgi:hypothetical protein